MSKIPPSVAEHLHREEEVTPERIDAFVRADIAIQLTVLGELRRRAADDSVAVQIAYGAAALAIITLFVAPRAKPIAGGPILVTIAVGLIIGVLTALCFFPSSYRRYSRPPAGPMPGCG